MGPRVFLIAHGLHLAVWLPQPKQGEVPFDTSHSPVFGDVRSIAVALAVVTTVAFVVTGVAFLATT